MGNAEEAVWRRRNEAMQAIEHAREQLEAKREPLKQQFFSESVRALERLESRDFDGAEMFTVRRGKHYEAQAGWPIGSKSIEDWRKPSRDHDYVFLSDGRIADVDLRQASVDLFYGLHVEVEPVTQPDEWLDTLPVNGIAGLVSRLRSFGRANTADTNPY